MPTPKRQRPIRSVFEALLNPHAPRKDPVAPPETGIFDSPATIAPVNQLWLGHLLGVIDVLADLDAWAGSVDEIENARSEIVKFMSRLMEADAVKDWRVNPDTCEFEVQLYESGDTWLSRGRLCGLTLGDRIAAAHAVELSDDRYGEADLEDPRSVAPLAPNLTFVSASDDEGDDADYREEALCAAVRALVDAICKGAIAAIEQTSNTVNSIIDAIDLVAPVIGASGLVINPVLALAGAIALSVAELVRYAYEAGETLDTAWLNDEDARESIACCWYVKLRSQEVSYDNFAEETLEDACDLSCLIPSAKCTVATAIHFAIREERCYWAFLDLCEKFFEEAERGFLPDCACLVWCVELDFTESIHGFTADEWGATWVSGQGWVANDVQAPEADPDDWRRAADIYKVFVEDTVISSLLITYEVDGTDERMRAWAVHEAGQSYGDADVQFLNYTGEPPASWTGKETISGLRLFLTVSQAETSGGLTGSGRIISLEICGQGYNPWA